MNAIRVLVVDDSAVDRVLACRLLEHAGWITETANDGTEALDLVAVSRPDIVVTDMIMPNLGGLQLVEELRARHPSLPVMIMTAHGSEDAAVAALRGGAAGYVSKRQLARHLVPAIGDLLELTRPIREQAHVFEAMHSCNIEFSFGNEISDASAIARQVELWMEGLRLFDQSVRLQVSVSLREVLSNAVFHGNLELESSIKDVPGAWEEMLALRMNTDPFRNRKVRLVVQMDRGSACFRITDEGPGFDTSRIEHIANQDALGGEHGRGLLLIRTFMDEVTYNEQGNSVTIRKHCQPGDRYPNPH